VPPAFIAVGRSAVAGMAHLRVADLLIAIVLLYYTEHTPFGRQMHAVGDSERVAFLAGIRTSRIKTLASSWPG
jgi:ribose transport system permease protein